MIGARVDSEIIVRIGISRRREGGGRYGCEEEDGRRRSRRDVVISNTTETLVEAYLTFHPHRVVCMNASSFLESSSDDSSDDDSSWLDPFYT